MFKSLAPIVALAVAGVFSATAAFAQGAPRGDTANGKKLFETIGCFECHGYAGQGGGAGPDASPPEKIYHVLKGELTVISGGKEITCKPGDTCFIAPNENREIVNRGNEVCTIFVAVAAPPA